MAAVRSSIIISVLVVVVVCSVVSVSATVVNTARRSSSSSSTDYPILGGAECTVSKEKAKGRLVIAPTASSSRQPDRRVVSSWASEEYWSVFASEKDGDGVQLSFTAQETSTSPMFTMQEARGNDDQMLLSLCAWSPAADDAASAMPHVIRCSSAHNHGVYTLIVTDVVFSSAHNETFVVGMDVEFLQSGTAKDILTSSGSSSSSSLRSELLVPEVSHFAVDCVPRIEDEDTLDAVQTVYRPQSTYMNVNGTFEAGELVNLNTLKRSGRSVEESSSEDVTLLDGGVRSADWIVQYRTLEYDRMYHFESVDANPRLVVGLSINVDAYKESGAFVPQGHYIAGALDGELSHAEQPFDGGSEFFLCMWVYNPALDGSSARDDGVLSCANTDDGEVVFLTPTDVSYEDDSATVVEQMRLLSIESGDALLVEERGQTDKRPGILVCDLARIDTAQGEEEIVFNTRTAYGDAAANFPNVTGAYTSMSMNRIYLDPLTVSNDTCPEPVFIDGVDDKLYEYFLTIPFDPRFFLLVDLVAEEFDRDGSLIPFDCSLDVETGKCYPSRDPCVAADLSWCVASPVWAVCAWTDVDDGNYAAQCFKSSDYVPFLTISFAFDDDGEASGFQWVMLEPGNPLAASDSSDDLSPFYSDEFPVLSREQWEKKS